MTHGGDKNGKYQCILFDFDGTLVPSLDYWLNGFKHAFTELGHTVDEEEIIKSCFYRDDDIIAQAFGVECHKTFWQLVQHKIMSHYDTAELFPGARDLLNSLRKAGVPVGLVTSSERPVIEKAFHHLNLHGVFQAVVTADDVENLKPSAEPVLTALSKIGKKPEEALFIGDYIVDVKAGKAAGTDTALFFADSHRRFHKEELLKESQPDFMFESYQSLKERLTDLLAISL